MSNTTRCSDCSFDSLSYYYCCVLRVWRRFLYIVSSIMDPTIRPMAIIHLPINNHILSHLLYIESLLLVLHFPFITSYNMIKSYYSLMGHCKCIHSIVVVVKMWIHQSLFDLMTLCKVD